VRDGRCRNAAAADPSSRSTNPATQVRTGQALAAVFLALASLTALVRAGVAGALDVSTPLDAAADAASALAGVPASFAFASPRSRGRTARALSAALPAALLASVRKLEGAAALAGGGGGGGGVDPASADVVLALTGAQAVLAWSAVAAALAQRTRPGDALAVDTGELASAGGGTDGAGGGGGPGQGQGRDPLRYHTRGVFSADPASGRRSWAAVLALVLDAARPRDATGWMLAVAVATAIAATRAVNLLVPWSLRRLVDALAAEAAGAGAADGDGDDGADPDGPADRFRRVLGPLGVWLALSLVHGGAGSSDFGLIKSARRAAMVPLQNAATRRMADAMFRRLVTLDVDWHRDRQTGACVTVVSRGLDALSYLTGSVLAFVAPAILDVVLASMYVGAALSPAAGLVVLVTMAAFTPLTVVVSEWTTGFRRDQNRLSNERTHRLTDALLNHETVALFAREPHEAARHLATVDALLDTTARMTYSIISLNLAQGAVVLTGLASGALLVAYSVAARRDLGVGDFVLFLSLFAQVVGPLTYLGGMYRYSLRCLTDAENMCELLTEQGMVEDPADPVALPEVDPHGAADDGNAGDGNGDAAAAAPTPLGIEFRDVSFAYRGDGPRPGGAADSPGFAVAASRPAASATPASANASDPTPSTSASTTPLLADAPAVSSDDTPGPLPRLSPLRALSSVSFRVAPGKKVAVVGATGGGKSTVLRLLVRLHDVTAGAVLVGGVDVRRLTLRDLREAVAVVPQDAVLFNDTLRSNVRYGRLDATDAEVEAACDAAELLEHARSRLPRGLDTLVGERGVRLSGGERQRVSVARAILKRARCLALDEATSQLDSVTERRLQSRLRQGASRKATQLVVAHRLSTVSDADVVVVLAAGAVAETGTHASLLADYPDGIYAGMWKIQAAGAE